MTDGHELSCVRRRYRVSGFHHQAFDDSKRLSPPTLKLRLSMQKDRLGHSQASRQKYLIVHIVRASHARSSSTLPGCCERPITSLIQAQREFPNTALRQAGGQATKLCISRVESNQATTNAYARRVMGR
jgi:hypothetical protein